jgi:exopolyphosphatase / guanosine-5'-triphosphate,3'-diphosphate pyrophosphatase
LSAAREIAVLDIGSNSVRLVLFRVEGRALWPVFNEKATAGLGRGAGETGRLNPDGVKIALRALRRFAALLDAKGVTERLAVATAAVRECEDGPDFVERVKAETGFEVRVISGEEEGRLSAVGVLSGMGEGDGVAGDLGGSSLELTPVSGRRAGMAVTLKLGPLAVLDGGSDSPRDAIDAALEDAASVFDGSGPDFYAVGGAWRAFAQLAMALRDYPLHLVHEFAMTPGEISRTADFAATQSEVSLASLPGVSSKRAATLPYAAMLLKRIVKTGRFKRVVFSSHGLREGVAFEAAIKVIEPGDPLLAGAEALASGAVPEPGFGPDLAAWIEPVFTAETPLFADRRDPLLRAAACRLADMGARMHPDHRAELAMEQTLYAPFGGLSHAERAYLALAIHHRYAGKAQRPDACPARRLIDDGGEEAALRLGLALRLGAALSGRAPGLLKAFALERTKDELVLRVEPGREEMVVDRALSRFETLAGVLGLTARVI